jgi:iron-sulfur cluster assembly protein
MSANPDQAANTTQPAAPLSERAKPTNDKEGIRLSELAAKRVREYMDKTESPDTQYLYVGVKGGGCSGLSYILDLRDERTVPPAATDEVFESHGLHIVCDLKSYIVGNLTGTLIDFKEDMMESGFSFNNPNAKHTCGCGSSYSA